MVEVMVVMVTSSKKTYFSKLCLPGHEFEHTLGDGEGRGSLVSCRLWGRTESDMTEAT